MEPNVAQIQRETRSSIEVTRNAKGDYQWVIKRYFDGDSDSEMGAAMNSVRAADKRLREDYLEGAA